EIGVGPEHADVDLVQVRAAHVHADRQRGGGEHGVDRLYFLENLVQRLDDLRAGAGVGDAEVFSLAVDRHRLQQRSHARALTCGRRIDLDGIGDDVLAAGLRSAEVGVGEELRVLVRPVALLTAGADADHWRYA